MCARRYDEQGAGGVRIFPRSLVNTGQSSERGAAAGVVRRMDGAGRDVFDVGRAESDFPDGRVLGAQLISRRALEISEDFCGLFLLV